MARTAMTPDTAQFRMVYNLRELQKNPEKLSYYNIRKLKDEGLVEGIEIKSEKRGRNPLQYQLTEKGREYVTEYVNLLKDRLKMIQ